jgi:hypothetical protein
MTAGECFTCLQGGQRDVVIIQLLCEILAAGGGGGGGLQYVFSGTGNPTGVVFPVAAAAIYFDTNDGTQYNWYSSAWH